MAAITVFVKKRSVACIIIPIGACHCSQDTIADKRLSMLIVAMLFVGSFCLVSNATYPAIVIRIMNIRQFLAERSIDRSFRAVNDSAMHRVIFPCVASLVAR